MRVNIVQLHSITKKPVLIPGHTQFAILLVQKFHVEVQHGGKRASLQLRIKYWVTKARTGRQGY